MSVRCSSSRESLAHLLRVWSELGAIRIKAAHFNRDEAMTGFPIVSSGFRVDQAAALPLGDSHRGVRDRRHPSTRAGTQSSMTSSGRSLAGAWYAAAGDARECEIARAFANHFEHALNLSPALTVSERGAFSLTRDRRTRIH
jgi:hypothetical protein